MKVASYVRPINGALARLPVFRRAYRWDERPRLEGKIDKRIALRAHPPLYGLAMYQQIHDSCVTLNAHIDISSKSASNMRLYEATGAAACLLTDWKENIHDLFEPGMEVVTFRSPEDCVEKAIYLLDHEEERQEIAAAGQQRTLRDHTSEQRAAQIDGIIRSHLKSSIARS